MLAYVYGVVPISLCRSGGCGVSAGNGKGVRIEFDDENDNIGSGAAATGEHLWLSEKIKEPDWRATPLISYSNTRDVYVLLLVAHDSQHLNIWRILAAFSSNHKMSGVVAVCSGTFVFNHLLFGLEKYNYTCQRLCVYI